MVRWIVLILTIFSLNSVSALSGPIYMNQKRALHRSIKLADGNVLVTGGVSSLWPIPWPHSSAEIFDSKKQKFIQLQSMNTYHTEHALVPLADGNILIIGGNQQKTLEIFDIKNKNFTALP